jgi:hypothetical protein
MRFPRIDHVVLAILPSLFLPARGAAEPPTSAQAAAADGAPLVPAELFTVPEGLEVTVWATSPALRNPTNIDFDEKGRLWVAEGVNYRGKKDRDPKGDRIVVLEDSDGNGKADKH